MAERLALENERLRALLRAQRDDLRACRRRLDQELETERRRIERDLHDGAQQRLVSVAMSLGLLDAKLPAEPEAAKPIAGEARKALTAALAELRELSQGIYPTLLAERGLAAALQELCERAPVSTELTISLDRPPSTHVAAAAYFAITEALTNAAKHAHATTMGVSVRHAEQHLILDIKDDGIGGAAPARGSGLRGLTDRIEALGGRLTVHSPPRRGTRVRAEIPPHQPPHTRTAGVALHQQRCCAG